MPLEEAIPGFLIAGFVTIITGLTLFTLFLWNRKVTPAFIWVIIHFVLLTITFYYGYQAITTNPPQPMASEELSFLIGMAGVSWILSMFSLGIAIFQFTKIIKRRGA